MSEPIYTPAQCQLGAVPCLDRMDVLVGLYMPCPVCAAKLEAARRSIGFQQVLDWPYWLPTRCFESERARYIKRIREDRKRRKAERAAAKARSVPHQGGLRRELHQIQQLVLKAQLGQPAAGYGAALTEASVRLCNLIELVDEADAQIAAKQQKKGGDQ